MFKDTDNCNINAEDQSVQSAKHVSKMNPFITTLKERNNKMFKDTDNCNINSEDQSVQSAKQVSKMNPFALNHALLAKPFNSEQPISSDAIQNSLLRENSGDMTAEEKIMINGDAAPGDIPVTPDETAHENGDGCDQIKNSPVRENSTTETTEATEVEKKLYDKINGRVKNFSIDNKKRVVKLWYAIGMDINKHYEGSYGKSEMKRMSDYTGIGESTLYKAVLFAKTFTDSDLQLLINKDYISFRLIVESFPIGRLQAIQILESSKDINEARQKIDEIKQQKSAKGTTSDDGNGSNISDSGKAPDIDVDTDKSLDEADKKSPDDQAKVDQKEGSQDGKGASGDEQPSSTPDKKDQDNETDNNKKVSGPDISGQAGSQDSFSHLFETMKTIGTKLVDASTEKHANGELRKIIQEAMMDLSNLLTLVPEASCTHFGATLSGGAEWESSYQSVAAQAPA